MEPEVLTKILIILAGIFSITGAVMNWDWFINSRRAHFFVQIFGRNGARVFYIILGIALIAIGIIA